MSQLRTENLCLFLLPSVVSFSMDGWMDGWRRFLPLMLLSLSTNEPMCVLSVALISRFSFLCSVEILQMLAGNLKSHRVARHYYIRRCHRRIPNSFILSMLLRLPIKSIRVLQKIKDLYYKTMIY